MYHEIFKVYGHPRPQPRTKHWAKMGKGRVMQGTYNPPGPVDEWKECLALELKKHLPPEVLEGPVYLDTTYHMPRPKQHFKTKQGKPSEELKSWAPLFHTGTPDEDNLRKPVMDMMKKIGYFKDDGQVCQGGFIKVYCPPGEPPGVVLRIRDLTSLDETGSR
jgi:Holliday junction resolvase RusA-like endonuclease